MSSNQQTGNLVKAVGVASQRLLHTETKTWVMFILVGPLKPWTSSVSTLATHLPINLIFVVNSTSPDTKTSMWWGSEQKRKSTTTIYGFRLNTTSPRHRVKRQNQICGIRYSISQYMIFKFSNNEKGKKKNYNNMQPWNLRGTWLDRKVVQVSPTRMRCSLHAAMWHLQ